MHTRQKARLTRLLRNPRMLRQQSALALAGADAQRQALLDIVYEINSKMLTPPHVRKIWDEVYATEGARFDALRDHAARLLNEIAQMHPTYRKKLNSAVMKAIQ